MIDEVDIYSKLESALFGSLVHGLGVSAPAVGADVAAIRLFDGPNDALATYVHASPFGLFDEPATAIQQWPTAEDSVFAFVRGKRLCDHAFRPQELLDDPMNGRQCFAYPFEPDRTVADAYCLTFHVTPPAWCMVVYLRFAPNPPFDDNQLKILRQFKPAIARVAQGGYHREIYGQAAAGDRRSVAAVTQVTDAKTTALMSRLSRTERLILSFLRSDSTERQIAQTIHRSPHTIHVHVKNIYRKLGVNSRRMLASLFDPE